MQSQHEIEPLLSVSDVAHIFGSTTHAVHESRRRGTLPGALGFKVGRLVKFDPSEIRAAIAQQKAERRGQLLELGEEPGGQGGAA